MTREALEKKTCKDLQVIAKEVGIVGRHNMTKGELINAINNVSVEIDDDLIVDVTIVNNVDATNIIKTDKSNKNNSVNNKVVKSNAPVIDMERKLPYIESANVGALVAFRLSGGKVKSAKIVNRSAKNRKLKLETEYGATYIVSYDDVLWVRTGLRWPRGVYRLLKGLGECDGQR